MNPDNVENMKFVTAYSGANLKIRYTIQLDKSFYFVGLKRTPLKSSTSSDENGSYCVRNSGSLLVVDGFISNMAR